MLLILALAAAIPAPAWCSGASPFFSTALGGPDVWSSTGTDVVELDDGSLAVCVISMTTWSFGDPWLVVLDPAGGLLLSEPVAEAGIPVSRDLESGGRLVPTPDGCSLLMGAYGEPRATGVDADAAILRLSPDGEIEGCSVLGSGDDLCWSLSGLEVRSDGSFVTAGNTRCGIFEPYAASFDPGGGLEWMLTDIGEDIHVAALDVLPDGGSILLMLGRYGRPDRFAVLDRSGEMVSAHPAGLPDDLVVTSMEVSGDIALVGGCIDSSPTIVCTRYDGGGILWTRVMHDFEGPVTGLDTAPGGDIAACGFGSTSDGIDLAGFCRLDSSGRLLWTRFVGGGNDPDFNSVSFTADGGLVLAGAIGTGDNGYRAWVLRTDASGSVPGVDPDMGFSLPGTALIDAVRSPLGWVVACGASTGMEAAGALSDELAEVTGLETGTLWIPDWSSLSGAEAWLSYIGPTWPRDDRVAACRDEILALCPDAYMVWVGSSSTRVTAPLPEVEP